MTQYRSDVDGLRALAVMPVLFFHAGILGFSGGYVGVDVFFVISGFLITSIIDREILLGRFSIVSFYERRVRRIFPALFLVIGVSSALGFWLLYPIDHRDHAQSVAATALFSSNFLFWLESGYFAGPAETKPLLHTWSLVVEEQYYVVFPLLMLAFRSQSTRARIVWVLGTLWVLSFAWSIYEVERAHEDFDLSFRNCSGVFPGSEASEACRLGQRSRDDVDFVVWGDSHANALLPGINLVALQEGLTGASYTSGGCPPLLNVRRLSSIANCMDFNASVSQRIAKLDQKVVVVLAARWARCLEGTTYGGEHGEMCLIESPNGLRGATAFETGLRATISFLHEQGREVVLVGPVPEVGIDVPRAVAKALRLGGLASLVPTWDEFEGRQSRVMSLLQQLTVEAPSVRIVQPSSTLCSQSDGCDIVRDGRALYWDDDHLSTFGALLVAQPIVDAIRVARRGQPAQDSGASAN